MIQISSFIGKKNKWKIKDEGVSDTYNAAKCPCIGPQIPNTDYDCRLIYSFVHTPTPCVY